MKILVIGSGGREYSLIWKILKDNGDKNEIYITPGSGGICDIIKCIDIKSGNIDDLLAWAKCNLIDFTIVGPEVPLALGIVDKFINDGMKIFGPNKQAAQLESSKIFSKDFMNKYNIPTADYIKFNSFETASEYIAHISPPYVIKADGLSSGKGCFVIHNPEEAFEITRNLLLKKSLGKAGSRIVIESFLKGEEASLFVLLDGKNYKIFLPSQDHKQIFDGDKGPNTGGMGAYAPYKGIDNDLMEYIKTNIIEITIQGLIKENIDYRGMLYIGLMLTNRGPYVMEYNARFGDPETQALMPLLKSNLLNLLIKTSKGNLHNETIEFTSKSVCCVVFASEGYPKAYKKMVAIKGLPFNNDENHLLFHAGTTKKDSKFYTNGGRVLNAIGVGDSLKDAIENAYEITEHVFFDNMHFRTDIGEKGLKYE